jgi:hypothetical protein
MPQEAVMNHLHYEYAKQRIQDLQQQAQKERSLKLHTLSWRVRSAKALYGLARRLEPAENQLETI